MGLKEHNMKTLQQHLTESLIEEAYKAQFKPADWENVLKQFKPADSNGSRLGDIEEFIYNIQHRGNEDTINAWIRNMIDGGVQDTPENHDILVDIIKWAADNYTRRLLGWQYDMDYILDYINNMNNDKTIWGVSQEFHAIFMIPKKRLSGNDKKLGEVVAKYGNSGDLEDIATRYSDYY